MGGVGWLAMTIYILLQDIFITPWASQEWTVFDTFWYCLVPTKLGNESRGAVLIKEETAYLTESHWFVGLSPLPVTVTTGTIPFLVGNPYKPSFPLLLGGGTTQLICVINQFRLVTTHHGQHPSCQRCTVVDCVVAIACMGVPHGRRREGKSWPQWRGFELRSHLHWWWVGTSFF